MENVASHSKNRYLFMFLSPITTFGVFVTIKVGVFIVGHMHEDIDGTYERMSSNLRNKHIYYLIVMMGTYCKIE